MNASLLILAAFALFVYAWGELWGRRKLARARADLERFRVWRGSWR